MRGPGGWHQTHSPRMDASGLEFFFFLNTLMMPLLQLPSLPLAIYNDNFTVRKSMGSISTLFSLETSHTFGTS